MLSNTSLWVMVLLEIVISALALYFRRYLPLVVVEICVLVALTIVATFGDVLLFDRPRWFGVYAESRRRGIGLRWRSQ